MSVKSPVVVVGIFDSGRNVCRDEDTKRKQRQGRSIRLTRTASRKDGKILFVPGVCDAC